jgi:hypothetical protein
VVVGDSQRWKIKEMFDSHVKVFLRLWIRVLLNLMTRLFSQSRIFV